MVIHHATAAKGDDGDDNAFEKMSTMFGPGHVDQAIRSAIHALPKERRNVAEVETEIRRIVERALKDLREDAAAFGHLT